MRQIRKTHQDERQKTTANDNTERISLEIRFYDELDGFTIELLSEMERRSDINEVENDEDEEFV